MIVQVSELRAKLVSWLREHGDLPFRDATNGHTGDGDVEEEGGRGRCLRDFVGAGEDVSCGQDWEDWEDWEEYLAKMSMDEAKSPPVGLEAGSGPGSAARLVEKAPRGAQPIVTIIHDSR